jgi:hypothetical protein
VSHEKIYQKVERRKPLREILTPLEAFVLREVNPWPQIMLSVS